MAELSKEEKKTMMKKWKAEQKKKYILSKTLNFPSFKTDGTS